jgi:hypothetical protein
VKPGLPRLAIPRIFAYYQHQVMTPSVPSSDAVSIQFEKNMGPDLLKRAGLSGVDRHESDRSVVIE